MLRHALHVDESWWWERLVKSATLKTDGGSRGNPGPAGIGFSLIIKDEGGARYASASSYVGGAESVTELSGGAFIGNATNNEAEYHALIWGLKNAVAAGVDEIEIFADSELIVKQVLGIYRVKKEALKPLHEQSRAEIVKFKKATIAHIPRAENADADARANESMDAKSEVGNALLPWDNSDVPQTLFDFQDSLSSHDVPAAETKTVQAKPHATPSIGKGESSPMTGIYELTVKDHFDAAHALYGYPGECRNLHGHTWDIEVTVTAPTLDEIGIVYDFKAIKSDLAAVLKDYDHAYINEVKPFDKISPTAENLARIIFERLSAQIDGRVSVKEVSVWESPIAKVTYRLT